jgi:hypothetical protein
MSARSVADVVAAHEPQLDADARKFANALLSFFASAQTASTPPVAAPPNVTAVVRRWRKDVAHARSSVTHLSPAASGRSLALSYYDALDKSLHDLEKSLEASDPTVAASASAHAVDQYSKYERLAHEVARLR